MNAAAPVRVASRHPSGRLVRLVLLGVVVIGAVALFRPHLLERGRLRAALAAPAVDADTLADLLAPIGRPERVLTALWESGRLPHRRAVLDFLTRPGIKPSLLRTRFLAEAAVDADFALRERAVGSLRPADTVPLPPFAGAQLQDADPEVRRLGLQLLRRLAATNWIPVILPLVEDPDPSVAVAADALLRRWSGRDSSLRLSDALPSSGGLAELPSSLATPGRLRRERQGWEAWWQGASHPPQLMSALPSLARHRPAVEDFSLQDLQGKARRLSEFRGRIVLLNFWATWCGSCAVEMPVLAELQRRHTNALVILGVSLDSFTEGPLADPQKASASPAERLAGLRGLVSAYAGRFRLGYPLLLDPDNRVGSRFDGNELPTQVLLDPEGRLVRRFIGGRSLETWEALLEDAATASASQ